MGSLGPRMGRWRLPGAVLLLASIACGPALGGAGQGTSPPPTSAPTPTAEQLAPMETVTAPSNQCQEPATEIPLGNIALGQIRGVEEPPRERAYYCVQVPDGVGSIRFLLSELTSPLNLYVGYPDLEAVQQGGASFWASDGPGIEDRVILIEGGASGLVQPGLYYVEVSAQSDEASSPYFLLIEVP